MTEVVWFFIHSSFAWWFGFSCWILSFIQYQGRYCFTIPELSFILILDEPNIYYDATMYSKFCLIALSNKAVENSKTVSSAAPPSSRSRSAGDYSASAWYFVSAANVDIFTLTSRVKLVGGAFYNLLCLLLRHVLQFSIMRIRCVSICYQTDYCDFSVEWLKLFCL